MCRLRSDPTVSVKDTQKKEGGFVRHGENKPLPLCGEVQFKELDCSYFPLHFKCLLFKCMLCNLWFLFG